MFTRGDSGSALGALRNQSWRLRNVYNYHFVGRLKICIEIGSTNNATWPALKVMPVALLVSLSYETLSHKACRR